MNRKGKSWPLFVVAILIVLFSLTAIFGVSYTYGDTKNVYVKGASDIRFGIDIRGGVDVTFMPADDVEATDAQMTAAKTVIEDRLVGLGITDYESYVDNNKNRIIVRFPWKNDEADFNPQTAIDEIGTTAKMVFRKGSSATGEEILSGDDVASASAAYNETEGWVVQLKFNSAGASAFATATTELAASNGTISIWLDDNNISTATVNEAITGGEAIIKGNFDQDSASTLANQINSGSLPFALSAESYSTISPSLGAKSLDVMVQAGIIAFILVAILMIVRYRLPGTIAVISLMGQAAATLAVVSGYFTVFPGSTLTLPVPAPTSHRMSSGRTASFASTAARTSCLVMGTSPRMKSSSGMPEEAYGQRELAARDAPAESAAKEAAAGADAPAGASEAALEPAGEPAQPANSISITFKSSNV